MLATACGKHVSGMLQLAWGVQPCRRPLLVSPHLNHPLIPPLPGALGGSPAQPRSCWSLGTAQRQRNKQGTGSQGWCRVQSLACLASMPRATCVGMVMQRQLGLAGSTGIDQACL